MSSLSPVSNHYAPSLVASEFEPLKEAALEPAIAALEAVPEPATAPILAVSGGGLLTRFGGPGVGSRRPPSKTPAAQTEQLTAETRAGLERARTELSELEGGARTFVLCD